MTDKEKPTEESWDGLIDTWLKAKHIKKWPDKIFITSVKANMNQRGEPQLVAKAQYDGSKFLWDINKTNMRKLQSLGMKKPKDLNGKSLEMNKVRVRNPRTGQQVDSLEVERVA